MRRGIRKLVDHNRVDIGDGRETASDGVDMTKPKREPEFDQSLVRKVSVEVYKDRLNAGNPMRDGVSAVDRMVAKDRDSGEKLAERSACFDALTRSYLRAIKATEV